MPRLWDSSELLIIYCLNMFFYSCVSNVSPLCKQAAQTFRPVLLVIFLSAVLLSGCGELPYENLDNEQLSAMLEQNVPIYDIRRVDEWRQTGVVEGSQLLTFVDAEGRMKKNFLARFTAAVSKDDAVILICRTGNRTRTLARYLAEKLGYTKVYNVRYGISDWIRDKRPVTRL